MEVTIKKCNPAPCVSLRDRLTKAVVDLRIIALRVPRGSALQPTTVKHTARAPRRGYRIGDEHPWRR